MRLSHDERVERAGRYGGGPGRLLADVPQLGFVLIAVLLLGAIAETRHLRGPSTRVLAPVAATARPTVAATSRGPVEVTIFGGPETGPLPGTAVPGYVATRQAELAVRAAGEPTASAAAVVSFSATQKPAALTGLLGGRALSAVLIRVQVAGKITDAGVLAITGPASLSRGLAKLTSALSADAAANTNQGDTTTNTQIPVNAEQKQAFYDEAATENAEIAVLRAGGPSIYGAVVSAPYSSLAALASMPGIRLVDPADDGVRVAAVRPHALAPDDTKTVATFQTLEGLKPP